MDNETGNRYSQIRVLQLIKLLSLAKLENNRRNS
jgi:hypothetical protein